MFNKVYMDTHQKNDFSSYYLNIHGKMCNDRSHLMVFCSLKKNGYVWGVESKIMAHVFQGGYWSGAF